MASQMTEQMGGTRDQSDFQQFEDPVSLGQHAKNSAAGGQATGFNDPTANEQARHFDAKTPLSPWPAVLRRTGFKYAYIAKDALIARALAESGIHTQSMVLDVGAGVGIWLDRIGSTYGPRGIGVDISSGSLRVAARKSHPRNSYVMADARNLPFQPDTFDLSISLDTLEHIEHPDRVINELVRVANGNGHLLIYAVSQSRRWTLEWIQEKALRLIGIDLLEFSAHKPELLVDPMGIKALLDLGQVNVSRFDYFHSFFSSIFDQPLLFGNLALKKLGAFSLNNSIQEILGRPLLAISSALSWLMLKPLMFVDRPWTNRGRSNGFLILGRIKRRSVSLAGRKHRSNHSESQAQSLESIRSMRGGGIWKS